jgi:hypothetical protein
MVAASGEPFKANSGSVRSGPEQLQAARSRANPVKKTILDDGAQLSD